MRLLQYVLAFLLSGGAALAQTPDPLIDSARDAFQRRDKTRLAQLADQAINQRHLLAAWVDYWRLNLRLPEADSAELFAFYERWPGSYLEDRLRNDWLLELGRRGDWAQFASEYPRFRLDDDRSLHCHALQTEQRLGKPLKPAGSAPLKARALSAWLAQRDADEACQAMAEALADAGLFDKDEVWRKLHRTAEDGRGRAFKQAAALLKPAAATKTLVEAHDAPARFLNRFKKASVKLQQEAAAVALVRLAAGEPERAAELMRERFASGLSPQLKQWVWVQIGRQAALRQQPGALAAVREGLAAREAHGDWGAETHAWAARAALRGGDWRLLRRLVDSMPEDLRSEPTWLYWGAQASYRSAPDGARGDAQRLAARAQLQQLASPLHFYGQLAAEELGLRLALPPAPPPLSADELKLAKDHAGLTRALRLIDTGLRREGTREWNFSVWELGAQQGDRALLAAAQRACAAEAWDRCIHTSERTQLQIDLGQRYPMPYREQVLAQARAAGLDPADPYGLIRQESRFIIDARSHVGASGLMQLMPATARWTAKKLGLAYSPAQLQDPDLNLRLGMAYLRMVLDDFDGALPLAAAAYNAGPGRPRRWREGEPLDAAAWAETIPFTETRDYVKKVLANATVYARLMGSEGATLRQRLGQLVGPRSANANAINQELP
jgi:soluble lytic murein transglycosylase